MTGVVLLDTDTFSRLSRSPAWATRLAPWLDGAEATLSFVTVAELHFGAAKAGWGDARIGRLEADIRRYGLLPVDNELPRVWGRLRADAVRLGHPLGQPAQANDAWLAACAVHYGVPLLTGNRRHFAKFPPLRLAD